MILYTCLFFCWKLRHELTFFRQHLSVHNQQSLLVDMARKVQCKALIGKAGRTTCRLAWPRSARRLLCNQHSLASRARGAVVRESQQHYDFPTAEKIARATRSKQRLKGCQADAACD
jgi:hypothetical protein